MPTTPPSPWIVGAAAAADYTGYSIWTIYAALKPNSPHKLRAQRTGSGSKLRFHVDDLDAWMRAGDIEPTKRSRPRKAAVSA